MTRRELITELKACEQRIAKLNDAYQNAGRIGNKPSQVDPDVCRRRQELREMLIQKQYTEDA